MKHDPWFVYLVARAMDDLGFTSNTQVNNGFQKLWSIGKRYDNIYKLWEKQCKDEDEGYEAREELVMKKIADLLR